MNVVLEPATERWIVDEAKLVGIPPEQLLAERLHAQYAVIRHVATLSDEEFRLLQKINEGFSDEFWTRYRALIARRDEGSISEQERQELIRCSDAIETKNAERAPYLLALAKRRGVSLTELIERLGLRPNSINP